MPLDTCWPPQRLAQAMHRFRPIAVIASSGFKAFSLGGPPTMLLSLLPPGCVYITTDTLQPQDPADVTCKPASGNHADSITLVSEKSVSQPGADGDQSQKTGAIQDGAQAPAYVICTSGSTGIPSAVCGSHSGMA